MPPSARRLSPTSASTPSCATSGASRHHRPAATAAHVEASGTVLLLRSSSHTSPASPAGRMTGRCAPSCMAAVTSHR
ncbi:unnamed protein product, partial [Phaeothamnion confervicola]